MAEPRATFTLTTSPSPLDGGTATGHGTFPAGTQVTVVATPSSGYVFSNWTHSNGLEASRLSVYTFVIDANTHLIANFVVGVKRKAFNLVKLTQCDAEGIQQRPVWVNPDQVTHMIIRDDGITHIFMRDLKEMFVFENPTIDAHEEGGPVSPKPLA